MAAVLWLLALLPCAVSAGDEQDSVRRAVAQGAILPLAEIIGIVQKQSPGRVLDVELERRRDGGHLYEIEILAENGQRLEFHVDARSGQVLDRASADLGELLPLATVLRSVLDRHPGHVLDLDLDRHLYEIEIALSAGGALRVSADARSGEILEDSRRLDGLDSLLPLPALLDRLALSYPGNVVEVELERDDEGVIFYEIDIRNPQGRTLELRLNAQDGSLLPDDD